MNTELATPHILSNTPQKRFTCSKCNMGFGHKNTINNHFKRKTSCVTGNNSIPICITTLYINCQYCNDKVKTETDINFMKKHLKKCPERMRISLHQKENEEIEEDSEETEEEEEEEETDYIEDINTEGEFIESLKGKSGVYIGYAERKIIKQGSSYDVYKRLCEHKQHLGNNFTIKYFFETPDYKELEKKILNHSEIESRRIRRRYGPKNTLYTELIQLSDKFTIRHFLNIVHDIKNDANSSEYYRNLALILMDENKELKRINRALKMD